MALTEFSKNQHWKKFLVTTVITIFIMAVMNVVITKKVSNVSFS